MRLKKDALWDEVNYLEYTADLLHRIDRMIFRPSDFSDFQEIKELARADINGKRIVVAVEADMGIYEIEPRLKSIYGERLGWVILKKGPKTYTLRQMDIFMPVSLEQVYDRLNFIDAAVRYRNRQNHWGGSVEIGGSPRETGTRLSPQEIVNACRDAVQDQGMLRQFYRFLEAAGMVILATAAAVAGRHYWPPTAWLAGIERAHIIASPSFGMYLGLTLATLLMLVPVAFRRPWQYGLAAPEGKQWWVFLPIAILGGLAGVGDTLILPAHLTPPANTWLLGLFMAPVGLEMLFRSLVHGHLAQAARIGQPKSRLFMSWPTIGSALLFAGYALWQSIYDIPFEHIAETPPTILPPIIGTFVMGLIMGLVRERSQSILPPILFQMAAVATYLAATHFVH
jgi:membrane protease YdiL (CAAX protease family)